MSAWPLVGIFGLSLVLLNSKTNSLETSEEGMSPFVRYVSSLSSEQKANLWWRSAGDTGANEFERVETDARGHRGKRGSSYQPRDRRRSPRGAENEGIISRAETRGQTLLSYR
jgi:hypothetical protein